MTNFFTKQNILEINPVCKNNTHKKLNYNNSFPYLLLIFF